MRERVHSLSSVPKAVFMSVDTMQELLKNKLKDLDSAEKHIVKALPKLATAASTPEPQSLGEKRVHGLSSDAPRYVVQGPTAPAPNSCGPGC
jgi:Domain of unknown function (DUF892)